MPTAPMNPAPTLTGTTDAEFLVTLARSGLQLPVKSGETILEAVRRAGLAAPHSCMRGTCGVCETTVIAGEVDHRDRVLSPAERAANTSIMICCSRSRSPVLELDL